MHVPSLVLSLEGPLESSLLSRHATVGSFSFWFLLWRPLLARGKTLLEHDLMQLNRILRYLASQEMGATGKNMKKLAERTTWHGRPYNRRASASFLDAFESLSETVSGT